MHDETDVRFIDAHAERGGGGDDLERALHEGLLHFLALALVHSAVVGAGLVTAFHQPLCHRLGVFARGNVDDAGRCQCLQSLVERAQLGGVVATGVDPEENVGPVHVAQDDLRLAHV